MALTRDVNELWRLVREALEDRRPYEKALRQIEEDAVSRWYGWRKPQVNRDGSVIDDPAPENIPFLFASMMLPQMVQASPRFLGHADGTWDAEVEASSEIAALNDVVANGHWERVLRPTAFDYLLSYAGVYVGFQENPLVPMSARERREARGRLRLPAMVTDQPMRQVNAYTPYVVPLPRDRWGWDMKARYFSEARFVWHESVVDIDDLVVMARQDPEGWMLQNVLRLSPNTNSEELGYAVRGSRVSEDRKQVRLYNLWVPEATLPERPPEPGEHGVFYCFAVHQASATSQVALEIKKASYFYGPSTGPYELAGQYETSLSSMPLNTLQANKDQTDMLNAVAVAIHRRMRQSRRFLAYDMMLGDDAREIERAADGSMVGVENLFMNGQPLILPIDRGGVDQADIATLQLQLDATSRSVPGADETLRGQTGSASTATEVNTAFSQTMSRVEYMLGGWEDFLGRVGNKARWYIRHDDRFFMRLSQDAKRGAIESMRRLGEGIFPEEVLDRADDRRMRSPMRVQGGSMRGEDGDLAGVDEYGVRLFLQVGSTASRSSSSRRQEEAAFNAQLAQIGGLMLEQPHVAWKERARHLGETWGRPGVERLIDEGVAAQMTGAQIMGATGASDQDLAKRLAPQQEGGGQQNQPGVRPGRAAVASEAAPRSQGPVGNPIGGGPQ